ncbi:carbonic anhydrase [Azospira restricta]|uniref:carbonic anhydrase n=1 Tax=Azospira restricta TaxID=404405 RepID=A0A974SNN9_9RHOO|nr:surface-adhesin E family protein [Azospira restricta]QRJ63626.1 carbonic anhydrase family protein [Azospira restricta]
MQRSRRQPSAGPAPQRRALAVLGAAAGLLLASPLTAHAAKWLTVAGGKSAAAKVEVDTASIDRSDGKVRAWHRETYPTRRLQDAWAFTYAGLTQHSEFHCDKRSAAPLRRLYLAADGSELKSEGFDGKDAAPVVPDSPLEAVLNHVCRKPAAMPAPAPAAAKPVAEPASEPAKPGKARGKEEPPPPPPKPPAAWSYDGKLGPARWSKLSEDYAACGDGRRQSPIDIRAPIRADLAPIRFSWKPLPLTIVDTGHTIQVNADDGGHIVVDGEEYQLQHFRFRHPGEELANGKRAVMSVQFEHRSKSGKIAILAVPLVEGKENRLVRTLWNALPLAPGQPVSPAGAKIDPGQLLPQKREYSTYLGSLTTPPCTEGVLWLVLKHPVSLSREQIADFAKVYKNNVRPGQAANGRVVKESR